MEVSMTFQLVAILVSVSLLTKCEATSIATTEDSEQATKKHGSGGAIVEINLGPLGTIKAGGGGGGRNSDGSQGGGFGGFSWGDFLNVGGGGGGFKNRDGISGGGGGGGFFAPRTESSGAKGSEAPLFNMSDLLDVRSFGGGGGQPRSSTNDSKGPLAGFLGGGGGGGFLGSNNGQPVGGGTGFGLVSIGDFLKVLGGGGGGIKVDKTDRSRRAVVRRQATTSAPSTTTRGPGISLSITASPGGAGGAGGLLSGLGGGAAGGLFGGGGTQEDIDEILSELGFGSHLAPAVTLDPLAYDLRPKYTKNGEPLTAINTRFKVLKRRIFAMDAQTVKPTK